MSSVEYATSGRLMRSESTTGFYETIHYERLPGSTTTLLQPWTRCKINISANTRSGVNVQEAYRLPTQSQRNHDLSHGLRQLKGLRKQDKNNIPTKT